jgi:hypothetical protein
MDDVYEFMGIAFNRYWVVVGAIALATIVAIYYGWHLARKSKSEEEKPGS